MYCHKIKGGFINVGGEGRWDICCRRNQVRNLLSEKPTGKYRFYINSIKAEADTGNGDDKVRPSY